jgi:cell division protease FtsH
LLEDRHAYARELLQTHRDRLDALARALLDHETLTQQQLEEILGPRPEGSRETPALPGQALPAANSDTMV